MRKEFRGTKIKFLSERGMKNGFMTSINVVATLSKTIVNEMGWNELLLDSEEGFRTGWDNIALNPGIGKGTLTFKPNGNGKELELEYDSIISFQAIFTESENAKKDKHQLAFTIRSSAPGAMGAVDKFWRTNQNTASVLIADFESLLEGEPEKEKSGKKGGKQAEGGVE